MKVAPPGKLILIGSEDVEVWPKHCVDGHKCVQCFFTGKYGCAPRWWHYPPWVKSESELSEEQSQPRSSYRALASLSGTYISMLRLDSTLRAEPIGTLLPGQPLEPIPDGGFTEETTEAVMARSLLRKSQPSREIDHSCEGCGYPALAFYATVKGYKDKYRCPRCRRFYTKDSKRPSVKVKLYLLELIEKGIMRRETIDLIQERFGVRIATDTYYRNKRKVNKKLGVA